MENFRPRESFALLPPCPLFRAVVVSNWQKINPTQTPPLIYPLSTLPFSTYLRQLATYT